MDASSSEMTEENPKRRLVDDDNDYPVAPPIRRDLSRSRIQTTPAASADTTTSSATKDINNIIENKKSSSISLPPLRPKKEKEVKDREMKAHAETELVNKKQEEGGGGVADVANSTEDEFGGDFPKKEKGNKNNEKEDIVNINKKDTVRLFSSDDDDNDPIDSNTNMSVPGAFRITSASASSTGGEEENECMHDIEVGSNNRQGSTDDGDYDSPRLPRRSSRSRIDNNDYEQSNILIEATLVPEEVTEKDDEPEEVVPEIQLQKQQQIITTNSITKIDLVEAEPIRQRKTCFVIILVIVVIVGIIIGALGGMNYLKRQNNNSNNTSSYPPTNSLPSETSPATVAPTAKADFLADVLPKTTYQIILSDGENDPPFSSPQSKAYRWLVNNPEYETYTNTRKLQLFALATVYYSLNGPYWIDGGNNNINNNNNNWLSRNLHECDWFTSEPALSICGGKGGDENNHYYEILHLFTNNITGTIPKELFLLTSLIKIDFSDNYIYGTIPTEIATLSTLRQLDFYRNSLSGSIPSEIGLLTTLTYIDLDLNNFEKTLPSEFINLSNLRVLSFAKNNLSGTISKDFFMSWKSIDEYISFEGNNFVGIIPSEIKHLSHANVIDFSNNNFIGQLPTELGLLTSATELFFENNNLSGTLPSELGLLSTNLVKVWLHGPNNTFVGTVPTELCNILQSDRTPLKEVNMNCSINATLCDDCGCQCK